MKINLELSEREYSARRYTSVNHRSNRLLCLLLLTSFISSWALFLEAFPLIEPMHYNEPLELKDNLHLSPSRNKYSSLMSLQAPFVESIEKPGGALESGYPVDPMGTAASKYRNFFKFMIRSA